MKEISDELVMEIEDDASVIDKTIHEIIDTYSKDLDEYIKFVLSVLKDDEKPPTDAELDDFALNLSTLLYFASVGCERMGIRDDLSMMRYKEVYNSIRSNLAKGTVADKNTEAELQAREERVINIIYNKSYKIMKAKVESAQDVLSSVKKVMSRRIAERELSVIQTNK